MLLGGSEKLPVEVVNTSHLKNTPLPVSSKNLENETEALKALYRDNGYKTLWTDAADRKALHRVFTAIPITNQLLS